MPSVALAAHPSRRSRNADTLNRLIEVAHAEFGRRGLQSARMEVVARECGVPKQFIYYHFGSREGLYRAVMEELCSTATEQILSHDYDTMDPIAAMRCFMNANFDVYLSDPFVARLTLDFNFNGGVHMDRAALLGRVNRVFNAMADRGISEGLFIKDLDKQNIYLLSLSMLGTYFTRPNRYYHGFAVGSEGRMSQWRRMVIDLIMGMMIKR